MILRLALWLIGGLMLGGIIHISTVLALPQLAPRDAWTRMATFGEEDLFQVLPSPAPDTVDLPVVDASFEQAVCRYSLDDGLKLVENRMPADFWSLGVFNRFGQSLFSLNDRTAGTRDMKLIIATPEQISQLRENPPDDLESTIVVETNRSLGFVVIRAFVRNPAQRTAMRQILSDATCDTIED